MLVEDPVQFAHAKFANLCAHIEANYASVNTHWMRALPPSALYILLSRNVCVHRVAICAGDTETLVRDVNHPAVAAFAGLCADDPKILRYLKLFCELID